MYFRRRALQVGADRTMVDVAGVGRHIDGATRSDMERRVDAPQARLACTPQTARKRPEGARHMSSRLTALCKSTPPPPRRLSIGDLPATEYLNIFSITHGHNSQSCQPPPSLWIIRRREFHPCSLSPQHVSTCRGHLSRFIPAT